MIKKIRKNHYRVEVPVYDGGSDDEWGWVVVTAKGEGAEHVLSQVSSNGSWEAIDARAAGWLKVAVRASLERRILTGFNGQILASVSPDGFALQTVLALEKERTFTREGVVGVVPVNWWNMLKVHLPKWLQRLFPVRTENVTAIVEHCKVCVHKT